MRDHAVKSAKTNFVLTRAAERFAVSNMGL
jgi:hypothetical protein